MNIDEIKQKADIAEIVEKTGYKLNKRGRYPKTTVDGHKSCVLDTQKNYYYFNNTGEAGSVIDWVMNREGLEFKDAVVRVCELAGLPAPDWSQVNVAKYAATKTRMNAWTAASGVFSIWLKNNTAATDYAHLRGWDDETISGATIGYTGYVDWHAPNATAAYDELAETLRSALVYGYRG